MADLKSELRPQVLSYDMARPDTQAWHLGHRIGVGISVFLFYLAAFGVALGTQTAMGMRLVMFPIGWIVEQMSQHPGSAVMAPGRWVILGSALFWSCLIASIVGSRKRWPA